jgi:hypothetical protein
MELALNIFLAVSALACMGAVILTVVSGIREVSNFKSVRKETEIEVKRIVQEFVPAEADDDTGRLFADLVRIGYFPSFRMGNHGKEVNYDRQLKDFLKYNTPEISVAMKKIGKNYEQYII